MGVKVENKKGYIMKIESYEIAMQSQHTYQKTELASSLSFSTVLFDSPFQKEQSQTDLVDVEEVETPSRLESFENTRTTMLNQIIQNLMSMFSENRFKDNMSQEQDMFMYHRISYMERFEENECLDFSTTGCVKTDSGDFDINVNFSMSRSFAIENRIDIFNKFDPLVINLDGDIPSLSNDTFSFDLDNDGESDQISKLKSGNGFLAYDQNGDGTINQGSELFGTLTGDGFGELAAYDLDANNWIDENDTIFDKLQIWLQNEDTNEKELVGLGEVGIGAIFLGSESSEFTFKTQMNQTLGEMVSCGVYLNEDGTCGNISQIDFAARDIANNETKIPKEIKEIQKSHPEPLGELLQA
jgi:hypothetical protein